MNYADYKRFDVLNGVGLRHSLFVSGCTHQCENCFNPATWNFKYGKPFDDNIQNEIIDDLNIKSPEIKGLSILGGCPMCSKNAESLIPFLKRIREECNNKNIWIWTGETFEEIMNDKIQLELLSLCDVLIDGQYIHALRDLKLSFRGSSNQRIIDVQESLKQGKVIEYKL
jgi:anaerobic ribonucleoside-triphosphate reductase activating protein